MPAAKPSLPNTPRDPETGLSKFQDTVSVPN